MGGRMKKQAQALLGKLPALLERWKYPLLIFLAGLVLLLWPGGSGGQKQPQPSTTNPPETAPADDGSAYCRRVQTELEGLLGQIHGAGKVRVMLTLKSGPASRYLADSSWQEEQEGERSASSREEKTVILERGGAYHEPALVNVVYPIFQGALVVAEGGDVPAVRLQISAAVAALLGLGTDQITVVKMK
ncbi:MAG: hypothetical protein IKQ54_06275 [Oscillospiraceae bacterium]|nr:hypothetical protein [Oscillospiraceae bacterium]